MIFQNKRLKQDKPEVLKTASQALQTAFVLVADFNLH